MTPLAFSPDERAYAKSLYKRTMVWSCITLYALTLILQWPLLRTFPHLNHSGYFGPLLLIELMVAHVIAIIKCRRANLPLFRPIKEVVPRTTAHFGSAVFEMRPDQKKWRKQCLSIAAMFAALAVFGLCATQFAPTPNDRQAGWMFIAAGLIAGAVSLWNINHTRWSRLDEMGVSGYHGGMRWSYRFVPWSQIDAIEFHSTVDVSGKLNDGWAILLGAQGQQLLYFPPLLWSSSVSAETRHGFLEQLRTRITNS